MSSNKKTTQSEQIDFDDILKAIKDVVIERKGLRVTARACNIDNTKLCRYIKRLSYKFEDLSTISDSELLDAIRILPMRLPSNMLSE